MHANALRRFQCEPLEPRDVPATYLFGLNAPLAQYVGPFVPPDQVQASTGLSAGAALPTSLAEPVGTRLLVAVGSDGTDGRVRVYDGITKAAVADFRPFPGFGGKVSVGQGDVNGDGVADVVAAAGPGGGPHVRVFDGAALFATGEATPVASAVGSFFAYAQGFTGGVSLAVYDMNGDGVADIVTGAGPGGGPHVRVWDGKTGGEVAGFYAYDPGFTGGVEVAAGDLSGARVPVIVTGAGPGGGPHVRTFSAPGRQISGPLGSFYAYDPGFAGGVRVAVGDLSGDRRAELITGAGPGGGSHVIVFDPVFGAPVQSFFAFPRANDVFNDSGYTGGVRVGVSAANFTGTASLLVSGSGADAGGAASTSAFYVSDGSLYQTTRALQAGLSFDTAFLSDAARGNRFEVTAGSIGVARATDAGLRAFAQNDLVTEHSAFENRTATLLGARGLSVPLPAPQDQSTATFLQNLSADRFDRVFASLLEDDHRRTAQRYAVELAAGLEPDAREYAAETLPAILRHGADARQLRQGLGG